MNIDVVKSELIDAQKILDKFSNNVTIFGSARITQDDSLAKSAYRLGKALSDSGFNVLTGAGPGIMQAVTFRIFIVNLPVLEFFLF